VAWWFMEYAGYWRIETDVCRHYRVSLDETAKALGSYVSCQESTIVSNAENVPDSGIDQGAKVALVDTNTSIRSGRKSRGSFIVTTVAWCPPVSTRAHATPSALL